MSVSQSFIETVLDELGGVVMNRYRELEELDIEFQEAESAWLEAKDDENLSEQHKQEYLSKLHHCLEKRKAHITKHWHDPAYYDKGHLTID